MIQLLQPVQLERKEGACHLVLWLCELFDTEYSFRPVINEVSQILKVTGEVAFELPPEQHGEDFVDGVVVWGAKRIDLYYERSLGYMQFSSPIESDIQDLYVALLPNLSLNTDAQQQAAASRRLLRPG